MCGTGVRDWCGTGAGLVCGTGAGRCGEALRQGANCDTEKAPRRPHDGSYTSRSERRLNQHKLKELLKVKPGSNCGVLNEETPGLEVADVLEHGLNFTQNGKPFLPCLYSDSCSVSLIGS